MEIFISIVFLIIIWILMTLYLIVILYIVINIVKFVKALLTTMPGKEYKKRFGDKMLLNIKTFLPKKKFYQIVIAMALINVALYWMSRHTWIDNKEALHKKAKEYLVVGDVLSRQMEVLHTFIHPDSYKLRPLVWLLHGIYDLGEKHLPQNDGEKDMWYYRFFIYPYAKKDILPYSNLAVKEYFRPWMPHFVGRVFYEFPLLGRIFFYNTTVRYNHDYLLDKDFREPQIRFLKKTFKILKAISTKPIKDPNMYRAYLQAYPGFAFYYSLNQGYYYNGSQTRGIFFTEPWYIKQDKEEFEWYLRFEKNFDNTSIQKLYGKKLAKNRVLLYCAILNIAEDLIGISYVDGTFSCKAKPIKTYTRVRNLLFGKLPNQNSLIDSSRYKELKRANDELGDEGGVLYKLSKREIYVLYTSYVDYGLAYKYIATEICGYKVYGKLLCSSGYNADKFIKEELKRGYESFLDRIKRIKKGVYR